MIVSNIAKFSMKQCVAGLSATAQLFVNTEFHIGPSSL